MNTRDKGKNGELIVYQEIISVLDKLGLEKRIIQNARFPFDSVYGEHGYITAEIDVVVFTPYLIFLFEVKNEKYEEYDYKEPLWRLVGGEPVSNPIVQNHTHKEVFCSELKVPRERVVTVEVLLENGYVSNAISVYPNDYVFSINDMKNKLVYLLATTCRNVFEVEQFYRQFAELVAQNNISEEEHIKHLKRTEKIETRIRNVIGYVNLHRTDVVYCTNCRDGKLCFKEKNYLSTSKSFRESKHYFLGCSNYGNNGEKCSSGLIYVDANKDSSSFKEIKPESISHRNNWENEKVTKTMLDEMESLKETNQNQKNIIAELKKDNEKMRKALEDSRIRNTEQTRKIKHLSQENKRLVCLKEKLRCYKRLFWRIYIFKE